MKALNITEVFCEVLSGLAIMVFSLPLLQVLGVITVVDALGQLGGDINGAVIGGLLVLAYILGLLMDAVGLAIGEWFLDGLLCKTKCSDQEWGNFLENVSSHVLEYRDTQWAYTSVYRNLFILLLPGGLLWFWYFWAEFGWGAASVVLIGTAGLELALWKAVKTLLDIYVSITRMVGEVAVLGD